MATEIIGLTVVNLAYFFVGAGALILVRWVTGDRATWYRIGVAYPIGIVILTIPASYLALAQVPVSWTATAVGIAVVALAAYRRRPWQWLEVPRVRFAPRSPGGVAAALGFLLLAALLAYSARTFAIRPVIEWDSWVIWLAKARLLYEDPSAAPAALRSGNYGQAAYPLALPTLEALGFSAMGRYEGTVLGLQFLALAAAFPVALWAILRAHARTWVIALAALTVVGAPRVLYQLLTRYADVPLGLFVGLGLAAGAAWVVSTRDEPWLLGCFVLFLGMAGLTKNEGLLFALAGGAALLAATLRDRRRLRQAAVATGLLLALILPWRLYCAAYGLTTPDYSLGHAASPSYLRDHADRVVPTVKELWVQASNAHGWGWLVWMILLALCLGVIEARWRLFAFASVWVVLALGGLILTYWISVLPVTGHLTNTSDRTIVSLLIGGAALVPLFVFPRRVEEG